jgi:hypothetical protein
MAFATFGGLAMAKSTGVQRYGYYVALDASILCNDPPLCTGRLGDQDGEPLKHRTNAFIRIPIV